MFNRRLAHQKILVNLLSGNAIAGVCVHEERCALILKGATVHQPGVEPTPADGEVLIDRANVDFIQIL